MSRKARRRPSWKKKYPDPFEFDLIETETGKVLDTIIIRKGAEVYHRLRRRLGEDFVKRLILKNLIQDAERVIREHEETARKIPV